MSVLYVCPNFSESQEFIKKRVLSLKQFLYNSFEFDDF